MARLPIGRRPRPTPIRPTISPTPVPTPTPTPTPAPLPSTFTLTTNIEVVPPSGNLPANSTVNGTITAGSAATINAGTYQTGDIINGNNTSVADITVASQVTGAGIPLVQINTLREVNFRNVAQAAQEINAALFNNVSQVNSKGSLGNADLSVTNADIATTYGILDAVGQSGTTAGSNADLTVAFRNATGAADIAKLQIRNAGGQTAAQAASLITVDAGAESITLATAGANKVIVDAQSTSSTTGASTFVATGNGANNITIANLRNGVAATSTTAAIPSVVDFSATTGANIVADAANFTGTTVRRYAGGSSTADRLNLSLANGTLLTPQITGFETLGTTFGAGSFVLDASSITGLTALGVSGSSVGANVNGLAATTNILFSEANNTNSVTFNYAATAPSVAYNLFDNVGNTGLTTFNNVGGVTISTVLTGTTGTVSTLGGLNLGGATTLAINTAGNATTNIDANLGFIRSTSASSFLVNTITGSGAGSIAFGVGTGFGAPFNTSALTTVNLSSSTGGSDIGLANIVRTTTGAAITAPTNASTLADYTAATGTLAGVNYQGGSGADLVGGTGNRDVINGGVGQDSIAGGRQADTVTGGVDTVQDTFVFAAFDSNAPTAIVNAETPSAGYFANGTTFTFGNGVDVITGTTAQTVVGKVTTLTDRLELTSDLSTTQFINQIWTGGGEANDFTSSDATKFLLPAQLIEDNNGGVLKYFWDGGQITATNKQLFYLQGTFSGGTFVVSAASGGVGGGNDFLVFSGAAGSTFDPTSASTFNAANSGITGGSVFILDQA